jgi:hypothetical protein
MARRCNNKAAITADIEAWHPSNSILDTTAGVCEVEVETAAPGMHRWCAWEISVLAFEGLERCVAAVARINIDDDDS